PANDSVPVGIGPGDPGHRRRRQRLLRRHRLLDKAPASEEVICLATEEAAGRHRWPQWNVGSNPLLKEELPAISVVCLTSEEVAGPAEADRNLRRKTLLKEIFDLVEVVGLAPEEIGWREDCRRERRPNHMGLISIY